MAWTGAQYMDLPMGYICELGEEDCHIDQTVGALESRSYKIIPPGSPETVGFDRAREECQQFGPDWDLVIFNHKSEFDHIQQLIGTFENFKISKLFSQQKTDPI